MSIYDSIKGHVRFRRHDGEFGIEIETESLKPYDYPLMRFWIPKGDDSLRNFGVEYVLKTPLKYGPELNSGLQEFKDSTKNIKFINNPIGGSVHVHVNFLNETFKTLGNFLTTAVYTENLLMEYSGPDRRSNLFCLPVCDAEETLRNITKMFKAIEAKNYSGMFYDKSSVKYANINLSAFRTFGSIEIRSFRGETNIEEVGKWVSILNNILEYSRDKDRTPKSIIDEIKVKDVNIIDDIFKDHAKALKCDNWQQKLNKNLWYAASIAYSVKDWGVLDLPPMPEFAPKIRDLELGAKKHYKTELHQLNLDQQDNLVAILRDEFLNENLKKAGLEVQFPKKPRKKQVMLDEAVEGAVGNLRLNEARVQAQALNEDIWQPIGGNR